MSASPTTPVVLALTVGGSLEPLRTAIREAKPVALLLIASAAGGGAASSVQDALSLKEAFQAGADERRCEVIEVPADDPGAAFSRTGAALDACAREWPAARIVADYTGATKSMSAALLMAALERDLETRITTGRRVDLVRVQSGTESGMGLDTRLIGLERDLRTALQLAGGGDYGAAAGLIETLQEKVRRESLKPAKTLRARLERCRDWASCLAAWDRFDHRGAWALLKRALAGGAAWAKALEASGHAGILEDLAQGRAEPSINLCRDLLENARRRQAQARFDDALGRLYRFAEACAQTQLYRRWGLKSGELDESDLPAEVRGDSQPVEKPQLEHPVYEIGLMQTVRLLRWRDAGDPLAVAYGERGPEWLPARNRSILAHGYRSVKRDVVSEAFGWAEKSAAPAMGMSAMPPFPAPPAS